MSADDKTHKQNTKLESSQISSTGFYLLRSHFDRENFALPKKKLLLTGQKTTK